MAFDHARTDLPAAPHALGRAATLAFGLVSYGIFFATFLYLIGFIGGFGVPKTLDTGTPGPVLDAIAVNLSILGLFAVQHTVMARPAFKRWWTRVVPPAIERSIFVLVTSLILCLLAWQWRPLPGTVWEVTGPLASVLLGLSFAGWGIVLLSTFLIDHFDLFGLKQTWYAAMGRSYPGPQFKEVLLYRWVRHPLMLGFLIVFWATPTMTVSHLFFAGVCTAYIAIALQIEEATLIELHGEDYLDYKRRVRSILPIPRRT